MRLSHVVTCSLLLLAACGQPHAGRPADAAPPGAAGSSASEGAGANGSPAPIATVADLAAAEASAQSSIDALRAGDFKGAAEQAAQVIEREPNNPQAHLVSAIASYRRVMHQQWLDVRTVLFGGLEAGGFNHRYMRSSLTETEAELAKVEHSLAIAAAHRGVSLELCLACWEIDWNHNGRIDNRDRLVFQIEQDQNGRPIPEGDPRRKPTFRFDDGDVAWARAFVSFQRAALSVVLAYDWDALDLVLARLDRGKAPDKLVIRLKHPERVAQARRLILTGLGHADQCRRDYLAETDDDREWVPNPRQRHHPLPLPVDQRLYDTWEGVIGDLTRLVRGEEGLSVAALAQLGDHQWKNPPRGYLDFGAMLSQPKDIVLRPKELERLVEARQVETALKSVLGTYYVRQMKPSPILSRLSRMKGEMERGEESLERKLRYLLWLN
ncbi:MAG: hypothetical protein JRI68_21370 [Deltaproteobacteria bacterium]|nr:hypothetical protein [Deltaproteobacteria bacterium]